MTRFEPDMQAAADLADASEPHDADEERPARRLLAHDVDDSWLLDDGDGWRPVD
jgi:hypothetical protein